ncbi:hypothetical protein L1049_019155 [Liquidambar formosana]|uniref:Uncharacterized protein n=1 Tax=Liquidambar formosana TaxID=63359 RepID=A0AAP0RB33_LIQFO
MYGQSPSDYDFALLESIRRHLLDDSDLPPSFLAVNSGNAPLHCRSETFSDLFLSEGKVVEVGDAVEDGWNSLNQTPSPDYEVGRVTPKRRLPEPSSAASLENCCAKRRKRVIGSAAKAGLDREVAPLQRGEQLLVN